MMACRDAVASVSGTRTTGLLLAVVSSLILTACGSTPTKTAQGGVATQGGGYYLDDGPGSNVPVDLDRIPDAVPRIEPLHKPALKPYTVMGQTFVPRTELTPYRERGHGSWYGKRFHGKPTSIGEPYDMFAMTAAHPTLPLPSYARVTNLSNGRTVIVRVNDRGPFLRGRLIDLSYAAAHRLGYVNAGSAMVEVESILPDEIRMMASQQNTSAPRTAQVETVPVTPPVVSAISSTPLAPLPLPAQVQASLNTAANVANAVNTLSSLPSDRSPQNIAASAAALNVLANPSAPAATSPSTTTGVQQAFLQLGAFSTAANATAMLNQIRSQLGAFADRLHLLDDGGRYRLQLGPFASADEARSEAGRIGALLNLQPFVVMR
jgi:rare lipoprotein A